MTATTKPKVKHGGRRLGAGRPCKAPAMTAVRDPLEFLLDVMVGHIDPAPNQLRAAMAAAQYLHGKPAPSGKKEDATDKARTAASVSKFRPSAAPRLVSSKA